MSTLPRVALIGAGFISDIHAEAIRTTGSARLVAIVDPVRSRAEEAARRWSAETALADSSPLLAGGMVEAVHVLVPPPLHRTVAEPFLRAGIHVLLEKPAAETESDAAALEDAAQRSNLTVNHNYLHHPAYRRLRSLIDSNAIGRLQHVHCVFHVPLRQLSSGQFGHWMFASARNLLLEQAVHPLSLLDDLIGPVERVLASHARPLRLHEEADLVTTWFCDLHGPQASAELTISLGASHPVWTLTAIGSDGKIEADLIRNTTSAELPTPWLEAADNAIVGFRTSAQRVTRSVANAWSYGASTLKLQKRSDPFFQSMEGSISAFYRSLGEGRIGPQRQGRRLVSLCEQIAAFSAVSPPKFARPRRFDGRDELDVLVIGGTGLIGTAVVRSLLAAGRRVGVLARGMGGLPPLFSDPRVVFFPGSVTEPHLLDAALPKAGAVIHLAHGGGGSWPEIEARMVGGARLVAEKSLEHGVRHLVFVSSIAALYLGDPSLSVSPDTEPDIRSDLRGDYARGKILSEKVLEDMRRARGLPVTIVRPGLVIGAGASPFHSGLGIFNRETHCFGWNAGRNPLPFVLTEDVAAALLAIIERPATTGRRYNLAGDVRPNARSYLKEIGQQLQRSLHFHPQSPGRLYAEETGKWLVKRAAGRRDAPRVTLHDLRSRGLVSRFDTGREKAELDWRPEADPARFFERALRNA
jgi:predicted dehydrogenase/nucleoside-diphosphate-sugar epimerase